MTGKCSCAHELPDLRDTLDQLSQHVHLLTAAVDQLTDELQWRNNELGASRPYAPLPVLNSLPAAVTTQHRDINRRPTSNSPTPAAPCKETLFD